MSDTDLMSLTVPELKKKLAEYELSRSGRKNDMVARLEQAGMLGDKEKAGEENSKEKDEMTTKRVNDAAGEAGPSREPVQKKPKIGKLDGAAGRSGGETARTPCLESCRPGKQHGCPNRSYGKPRHGKTKSCHEVERILTVLGINYDASRCVKAAIMRGHINVMGEEGDLDLVVYQQEGECGHVIQAKLGELLRQPDYAGLDYEDGCENATVVCTECDEGRTYVTGLCKGQGTFDDGKYHNHCWGCPGFGSCIGDYRLLFELFSLLQWWRFVFTTRARRSIVLTCTASPSLSKESIIVQRVVTNSSSTYKLKDHDGKIVVDKKVKEELDRILLNFNIQVENPIAVLNQDTAKTFLFACEPDKLYTFFMRATQLDQVKADYAVAAKETSAANALLKDKIESMPELKKEVNKWEKKYEYYQNLAEKKKDIDKRKAEVAWAVVRDGKVELEELNGNIDTEKKKIPVCDENIEKFTQTERDAREKKKTIETEIQSMSKEVDQDNAKLEDLKLDYHSKREAEKKKKQSVAELERKVKKTEGEVEQYEEEIRRLRSTGNSEYEEKHKERQELMKKLGNEKEALEAQMATTTNHLNHLRANHSQSEDSMKFTRNELNAQRTLANKISADLEAIRKGGDRLSAFGPWMPKLVEEIKKNINFSKAPIGPLGAYINLKQNISKEEARLVEGELGGLVYSFLVDNSQDQKELYALFQRLRLPFKPSIYTCPFADQKYDISQGKVQSPPHLAIIDYLEIDNASVFNRVVDSGSAEKILIIWDEEHVVQNLLHNVATVPKNLKHAITKAGYQYYPAPEYRSYFKENNARGVIKSSLADIIAELEVKMEEEKAAVITLEQVFAQKNEEHLGHQKMIDEEDRKVKAVQSRIRQKNMDLVKLKNEDQDDAPPDISALEDDLNCVREKLKTLKIDMNQAVEEFKELVQVTAASKQAHTKADDEIAARRELIDPLSQELSVEENAIKKARKYRDHYTAKKNEYKEKILVAENELAIKQVRVECAITKAKEWSEERIDSNKKIEFLSKELVRMEESLKTQERTQEPRELVSHNFEKFRHSYARAKHQINYMSRSVTKLFGMLEARKKGVDAIIRSTTRRLNVNFTSVLNSRQFLGRLYFDHNNHTLEIIVNPSGDQANSQRKLATLSGGEKSFASVSLVLALWETMSPPFRILDEFDVFMDAVNRRFSLKAITDFASRDRKYQFVFLTPLNTDNIDVGEDLKIIKLRKAVTQ